MGEIPFKAKPCNEMEVGFFEDIFLTVKSCDLTF